MSREESTGLDNFQSFGCAETILVFPVSDSLERHERGVTFIHVTDMNVQAERPNGDHAADAKYQFLLDPVLSVATI